MHMQTRMAMAVFSGTQVVQEPALAHVPGNVYPANQKQAFTINPLLAGKNKFNHGNTDSRNVIAIPKRSG